MRLRIVNAVLDVETNATVKFSIVTVGEFTDAAAATANLTVLPNSHVHVRGTTAQDVRSTTGARPVDDQ